MQNNIIIRNANIEDLNSILKLNSDLFNKEYDEYDKSLNLNWVKDEGGIYFLDKINNPNSFLQVAEMEGMIIGYICGSILEPQTYRQNMKYAELENMFIDENFRGKGIGKTLVKNFIDWCRSFDVKNLSVTASVLNVDGIKFYKNLGFKDYDLTLDMSI